MAQVSKSVHGLLSLMGYDAEIQVGGLSGCEITDVAQADSTPDRECDQATPQGDAAWPKILLGDLHWSNTRQVLVGLRVPPGEPARLPAMRYTLSYMPADGTEPVSVNGVGEIVREDGPQGPPSPEVICAVAIQAAVRSDMDAATALEDGDSDAAIAAKEKSIETLQVSEHSPR